MAPQVWSIASGACIASLTVPREGVAGFSLRGPSGGYASVRGLVASPLGFIATATHGNWAPAANRLLVWWPGQGGATRVREAQRAEEFAKEEAERALKQAEAEAEAERAAKAEKEAREAAAKEADWQSMVEAAERSKAEREAREAEARAAVAHVRALRASRTAIPRGAQWRGAARAVMGAAGLPAAGARDLTDADVEMMRAAGAALGQLMEVPDGQLISLGAGAQLHDYRSSAEIAAESPPATPSRSRRRPKSRKATLRSKSQRAGHGTDAGAKDVYLGSDIEASHTAAKSLKQQSAAASAAAVAAAAAAASADKALLPIGKASREWTQRWRDREVWCSAQLPGGCGFTSDCLSADGDTLVCIGGDGDPNSVSVYSASAGEVVRCLSGHTDKVACVACEGDVIASSGRDKTIRLWSRESGACTAAFASGDEVVYGLALRRGLLLCGEGLSKYSRLRAKAKLWQISPAGDGARCIATYAEHTKHIYGVALHDKLALTASHDASVCVWPIAADAADESKEVAAGHTASVAKLDHPSGVRT